MEINLALGMEPWAKPLAQTWPLVMYGGALPFVLSGGPGGNVTTCNDRGVAPKKAAALGSDAKEVQAFAVAPGGAYAAGVTAGGRLFLWSLHGDTIIWIPPPVHAVSGDYPSPLGPPRKRGLFKRKQRAHHVRATAVAVSPAGRRIAVQANDGWWWLWLGQAQPQHGRWVAAAPPRASRLWKSEAGATAVVATHAPACVAFSDDPVAGSRLQMLRADTLTSHESDESAHTLRLELWHLPLRRAVGILPDAHIIVPQPDPVEFTDEDAEFELGVVAHELALPTLHGLTTTRAVAALDVRGNHAAMAVNVASTRDVLLALWDPHAMQMQRGGDDSELAGPDASAGRVTLVSIGRLAEANVERGGGVLITVDAVQWLADNLMVAGLFSSGACGPCHSAVLVCTCWCARCRSMHRLTSCGLRVVCCVSRALGHYELHGHARACRPGPWPGTRVQLVPVAPRARGCDAWHPAHTQEQGTAPRCHRRWWAHPLVAVPRARVPLHQRRLRELRGRRWPVAGRAFGRPPHCRWQRHQRHGTADAAGAGTGHYATRAGTEHAAGSGVPRQGSRGQ